MLWNKQTKQNLAILSIAATVLGITVAAWAKKPVKTPPDHTAPAAIIDLAVAVDDFDTVTLTWTATGDDGVIGTAYLYDVRYSTSEITAGNFNSATSARSEPLPQASGFPETFTVTGLSGDTTYWLALKVADEAGNLSGLSNVVSATTLPTPSGAWEIKIVDSKDDVGYYDVGYYNDLAYDLSGNPSIAYSDSTTTKGLVKFAHLSGTEWVIETVGGISNGSDAGISLVYDSFGNPSMSYIERGQLKFARWNGSSWEIEQVDSQLTNSGGASLAYAPYDPDNPDNNNPSISYCVRNKKTRDLMFARWNGTSWDIECVEAGEGERYGDISLAYDFDGNPAIAYRNKFAHWNGDSWEIDILETNDVFSNSLAYDLDGIPTIVYEDVSESGRIRVIRFAWLDEESGFWVSETVGSGTDCSHAYNLFGIPFISYYDYSGELNVLKVARGIWDVETKTWLWDDIEIVETVDVANDTSIAFDAFDTTGSPSVSYAEWAYDGRFLTRDLKFASQQP